MNRTEAFLELARGRRSIRRFRKDPVPPEILRTIIEAATWAPSASNRQGWEFTVITSAPMKKKMGERVRSQWESTLRKGASAAISEELGRYLQNFDWFAHAPVLVAISTRCPDAFLCHLLGETANGVAGAEISAAMAAQNLMLAAHASGIGSCCVTGPLVAQEALKELLDIGKRKKMVCLVALGYPAEQPEAPLRKPVEKIVKYVE